MNRSSTFLLTTLALAAGTAPALAASATERVSVGPHGRQANDRSGTCCGAGPAVSADGRYVAFTSAASNLVPGDTNAGEDVFVRDRQTGATERVSVASDGTQANDGSGSYGVAISGDGRYVAFNSFATNLVKGDTNGAVDIFVHDRKTGTTERVSLSSDGVQGNHDSGVLGAPAISGDGRYVAFVSYASNLVAGDTNDADDIFVRDRKTGTTERVSVSSTGGQGNGFSDEPAISADGRIVAFSSNAHNLVAGDNDCCSFDVFVHDRKTGRTELVDLGPGGVKGTGVSGDPSLSKDGRFVAFDSKATNLVPGDTNRSYDVFVRDRQAATTERVSVRPGGNQANGVSGYPSISADGQIVAFTSIAPNLVAGDTNGTHDIFVRDRQHHTTTRVSVGADGAQGNARTRGAPAISADGSVVAFNSDASNLVQGDTNGVTDAFVRTR